MVFNAVVVEYGPERILPMKTCPAALKKIVEHFAPVGVLITITPAEDFVIDDGWHGAARNIPDVWAIKHLDRLSLEVSDEVSIGFLIHEIIHSLVARPAWDHTFNSDVYNWSNLKSLLMEEHPIIIYGRNLITTLDIQEEATRSASTWDGDKRGRWKQPGGDLLSHDNIGMPGLDKIANAIELFAAYGVTDKCGRLIGSFDIDVAKKNVKTILKCLKLRYTREDVLGEFPQEGSAIYVHRRAA